MFAVNHWQLDQNSCLPNDAVLCSMAALPAAAGTPSWGIWVLQGRALQDWWSMWWPWDGQCGVGPGAGGAGRSLPGTQPPASLEAQQSRTIPPSKPPALTAQSRRGRKDFPQPKLQRKARARAFSAGTLSGREEQG